MIPINPTIKWHKTKNFGTLFQDFGTKTVRSGTKPLRTGSLFHLSDNRKFQSVPHCPNGAFSIVFAILGQKVIQKQRYREARRSLVFYIGNKILKNGMSLIFIYVVGCLNITLVWDMFRKLQTVHNSSRQFSTVQKQSRNSLDSL